MNKLYFSPCIYTNLTFIPDELDTINFYYCKYNVLIVRIIVNGTFAQVPNNIIF
jgi:hypothetical protein